MPTLPLVRCFKTFHIIPTSIDASRPFRIRWLKFFPTMPADLLAERLVDRMASVLGVDGHQNFKFRARLNLRNNLTNDPGV